MQKELGLIGIKLKETEGELSIQKALSTKVYDDVSWPGLHYTSSAALVFFHTVP